MLIVFLDRASTVTEASRIGVQGLVCNMPDGSVSILATGSRSQLEELIAWCRIGPPLASVTSVTETEPMRLCEQDDDKFSSFRVC